MLAVELSNISKSFASVAANRAVNLHVTRGSIHALVGENGAGKSTLMNILYGMYPPDNGVIKINDTRVTFNSPADAIAAGIGMVHQHFMLVPPLTVVENIVLGAEPTKTLGFIDRETAESKIRTIAQANHLPIPTNAIVETLSVGLQQRVEILKLLYRNAEILILDEPTPVLTPQEVRELFVTLRTLRDQGKTIILITHKLREVMELCERVTVMRRGETVAERETASTNEEELASLMVGRKLSGVSKAASRSLGEEVVHVKDVYALNDRKLPSLNGVTFNVRGGEIFGIAGVEGNGQSELVQVLAGLRPKTSGGISIDHQSEDTALISHIPEDRHRYGIVLDFTVEENFILGRQSDFYDFGRPRSAQIQKFSTDLIKQFDIRLNSPLQRIRTLSGGNQQKVVAARELSKTSSFIIASHPTRGLDIGAMEFVHTILQKAAAEMKAILLISSDLEELRALSTRIGIMYEGRIVAIVNPNQTTDEEIGRFMTGANRNVGENAESK